MRLWTAEKLAEFSGADSVAGASWMTTYAKALGARIAKDVDLHSPPPVTGFLKLGRGAAVEPEVDLTGYWVDGDTVHIGHVRIGADARIGARSTLFPGTRIGKGAEIAAGSTVRGAVPAGQRWAGSPAGRTRKEALKWPSSRPPRSHFWAVVYGTTSLFLEYFGLRDLDGLPASDELRRVVVQKPESLLTVDPGLATAPPEELAVVENPQAADPALGETPSDATSAAKSSARTSEVGTSSDSPP